MPAPPEESEPAMMRAMGVMRPLSAHPEKRESGQSTDGRKAREQLEHPACDQGHGVGEEQDAGQDEKAAEELLDGGKMLPEPLHGVEEGPDANGGGDEGDAEAKRIDEQEADALAHRVLACGDGKDRPKHGTDARRPAEGESKPDDIGADQARRARVGVVAR